MPVERIERRLRQPVSPRIEVLDLDGHILAKRAAKDTGVVLATLAKPGQEYLTKKETATLTWPNVKLRTEKRPLEEYEIAVIASGDIEQMERFEVRIRELHRMVVGKALVTDDTEDTINEAINSREQVAKMRHTKEEELLQGIFDGSIDEGLLFSH